MKIWGKMVLTEGTTGMKGLSQFGQEEQEGQSG